MNSLTRSRVMAAVTAVAVTSLIGCSSPTVASPPANTASSAAPSATAKALRIGFIPPTMSVPAFQGLAKGLEGMGAATGDTVVTAEAKFDPASQLQTIQQWVKLGQIDALWVIPVAAPTLTPALKEAQAKGIVVIAGGKPSDYGMTDGQPGITFSDTDNAAYGKGVGDLMAKCVTGRLGGTAKVLFVANSAAQASNKAINQGATTAFAAGAPGATVTQTVNAKSDRAADQVVISTALQANPDSQGLFTGDAESTMAAVIAYANAGKDPAESCIVGNGGTDEQKKAIQDGKLYGVVAFDFAGDMGQNQAQLHKMAADPTAPGTSLTVPITILGG